MIEMRKSIVRFAEPNKPTHVSKGNIFLDMGLSASEASVLKIKSKVYSIILERVRTEEYHQRLTRGSASLVDWVEPRAR
jgi:hypothetical protein